MLLKTTNSKYMVTRDTIKPNLMTYIFWFSDSWKHMPKVPRQYVCLWYNRWPRQSSKYERNGKITPVKPWVDRLEFRGNPSVEVLMLSLCSWRSIQCAPCPGLWSCPDNPQHCNSHGSRRQSTRYTTVKTLCTCSKLFQLTVVTDWYYRSTRSERNII